MTKRAVLYARVSGDDRSKEGRNLASQLEMGREYAQERGHTGVAELAEDDRGASGVEIDLPKLNRIRAMAAAGEFDVLVVREIDRLSRNLAKQLIVEQEMKMVDVSIEYVLGEYPDTPEGNLQKHVKAAVAEYEREQITRRMTRGRYNKVKAGKVHLPGNHRPPYGYRASEDGDNLVPYEPEARIVRLMFQWYTEGDETGTRLSMRGIAKRLAEMAVPTWGDIHGMTAKKAGFAQWRSTTVREMLRSRTYMGLWGYGTYGGRKPPSPRSVEIEVPALVSVETWQAAQEQMARNVATATRNTRYEYLLRTRVTCECTYQMASMSRRRSGKVYLYYVCGRGATLPGGGCGAPSFRADHVDALVWDWLKDWLQDPKKLAEKLEVYRTERKKVNAPILAQIETINDLLREHKEQLERLIDLYLSGTVDKNMLVERKKRLENTIAKLEIERGGMEARLQAILSDDQICEVATFGERLSAGLEGADEDFAERCRIVELLDVRAVLVVENGDKVVYPTFILCKEPGSTRLSMADYAAPHRYGQKMRMGPP
ncbi:MAG: recombinase family protein [Anaerolineae bacterium]|nr:recombinase family protein [Anaerolineae bacterium]